MVSIRATISFLVTTKPTTTPTTKPTTTTTKPTTAPTTKPTTEPTTKPTTAPTTAAPITPDVPTAELYGDANCDGVVTIADAAAIYQKLANADKYTLSEKGTANADCCNPGGGITAADALAIQKLDAKLISALPIEE